ncbi:MFS transporter [Catellatospora tritici]|uniref:MFS transporter n=1 Tax=Catellatospora tritici TaxID=2851566 RepID=UPI001C2D4984|nr:MFS transporter [Catellatospora tritici]MBV1851583.1 MFS transporter [Catellatospora tritici]
MRLINGNYRRLWIGHLVSTVGDQIFDTTVLLWIGFVLLPGDRLAPLAVGGVLAVRSAATVLVGPFVGVFVDRWDKLRTMLRTDLVRAALIGVLTVAAFLPDGTLPVAAMLTLVYVLIFAATVAAQFFLPARMTLIRDIVEGDADRARAAGIGQATVATAGILGPPLAAPLLFAVGFQWALLINALSFLGSYAVLRTIRPPALADDAALRERPGFRQEFVRGLAYAWRTRFVRAVLVAAFMVTAGGATLNTLNPFFFTENLHSPASRYGFVGAAMGAGVIVGALLAGRMTQLLGGVTVFAGGIVAAGIALVAYAHSPSLAAALTVMALFGLFVGALDASLGALMMRTVDRAMMGRVIAILSPLQQLSGLVGIGVAGLLAGSLAGLRLEVGPLTFGRLDLLLTAAGLLVLSGGVYAGLALRGHARHAPATPAAEAA